MKLLFIATSRAAKQSRGIRWGAAAIPDTDPPELRLVSGKSQAETGAERAKVKLNSALVEMAANVA